MMDDDPSEHTTAVAKGSLWNLLGSAFFYLSSFLYTILIARVVSQDDLGIFFLALGIVQLPAVFDNLGLASSIVRYVPYFEGRGEKEKIRSLLRISYIGVTLSALALMLVLWLLSDTIGQIYQNSQLPESIRLLSVFLLLSNLLNLGTAFIRSRTDMKSSQLVSNLQNVLKLAFTLLLVWHLGPGFLAVSLGLLLSFLPSVLLSFHFVRMRSLDLPPDHGGLALGLVVTEVIPYGLMLGLVGSLNVLFLTSGRVLVGYLAEPSVATETVAVLSVTATLATVLLNIPSSVGSIFMPIISKLFGKGKRETMLSVTETAQRWTMLMAIPSGLILMLFSQDILLILYGEKYLWGATTLSILTAGTLIKIVSFMLSLTLSAMRKLRIQILILLVSGVLNVILNLALVPVYGIDGSAFASAASFALAALLLLHYARKEFSFRLPLGIYKLALSGIATALAMLLLTSVADPLLPDAHSAAAGGMLSQAGLAYLASFAALSAATVAVFFALSLLLRCLKKEDAELMAKALRRIGAPKPVSAFLERFVSHGIGD